MIYAVAVLFLGSVVQAQFAQPSLYKVWLEGVTPCDALDSLVDVSTIKVSHFNRTTLAVNGNLKLLQKIDEKTNMRLVGYSKNSHGKWTKSMLDSKVVTVCDFIRDDETFWPAFVKISDLPAVCPLNAGEYHFQDASLSIQRLPPMVPKGCYKLVLNMWTETLKSCNTVYVKVTGPRDSADPRCT